MDVLMLFMVISYFYPRSPCGERRLDVTIIGRTWDISIHALLAESDHYGWSWYDDFTEFLSTLSLRRATLVTVTHTMGGINFYPRSPCGERQYAVHVLSNKVLFLSTLSLRRATGVKATANAT